MIPLESWGRAHVLLDPISEFAALEVVKAQLTVGMGITAKPRSYEKATPGWTAA
jgi:hypothetical protein